MSTLGYEVRLQAGVARRLQDQLIQRSAGLAGAASGLSWVGASGDACRGVLGELVRELNSCAGKAGAVADSIDAHARSVEAAGAALAFASPAAATIAAARAAWKAVSQ